MSHYTFSCTHPAHIHTCIFLRSSFLILIQLYSRLTFHISDFSCIAFILILFHTTGLYNTSSIRHHCIVHVKYLLIVLPFFSAGWAAHHQCNLTNVFSVAFILFLMHAPLNTSHLWFLHCSHHFIQFIVNGHFRWEECDVAGIFSNQIIIAEVVIC